MPKRIRASRPTGGGSARLRSPTERGHPRGFDKRGVLRVRRSSDKGEGRPLSQGEPSRLNGREKKERKKNGGIAEGARARLFRVGVRPIVRYRTRAVHGERDNE